MTTYTYPAWIRIVFLLIISTGICTNYTFSQDCNNPITGKDAVVDEINSGFACLFCGNADVENVIDGDLSNYLEITSLATLPGAASLISVKDIRLNYPAGRRTGFVIEPVGGLLSAGVLANFQIRTYLENIPQETANIGNSLLNVNILGGAGGTKRLDFVTTLPFDEVELVVTSALTGLNTVRVFYAYEEMATGCDYNCITEIIPLEGFTPSIENARTGITGPCELCDVDNEGNSIDDPLGNFATIDFGVVDVGATGSLSINAGTTIAAGNDVGFAIEQNGLLDLLSLNVLGNIRIRTYLAGVLRDDVLADDALANVGVLTGGINLVSFKTSLSFDEVRISITNISAGLDYYIYYAFIRPDADNDGFPDCVDKCVGSNDNLDADGDGIPDACDLSTCTVNAGLDISVCPPTATAQLAAAGVGQTWSFVSGPSTATINSNGMVSGLNLPGTYIFRLAEGTCTDDVAINYVTSALDNTCNDPISGANTVVTNGGLVNGICVLCSNGSVNNLTDGDLSNYVEYNALLSLLSTTTLVGVEDLTQTYPAGTRTGFVISVGGGLLDAAALSGFQIRTYLNGTLQETATTTGNVLGASVVPGPGNKFRISFVTTQSFDEVELLYGNAAGVLTTIRVYYAFEESASCPNSGGELACVEELTASSTYCAMIDYERTGLAGAACVLCELENLGNLIDDVTTNYTTLTLTAAALTNASVAISTRQTIPAGYETGFAISGGAQLLNATVLGGLRLTTYLNGIERETILANDPLLSATLLGDGTDIGLLSFRTTLSFDEVQLTVEAPATANVLSNLNIYYAFVRRDTDGDGTPDCYDKCCGSADYLDEDGDGTPDACDNNTNNDYGDLGAAYPTAIANVLGGDVNNNGIPDGNGAVWAGLLVDVELTQISTPVGTGDDAANSDDEDGLIFPPGSLLAGNPTPYNFFIATNSNSAGSITRYYGLWFDWDDNGTFEAFYSGSVMGTGPVEATVAVTVPANAVTSYKVRVVVSGNVVGNTPGGVFNNAEVEDHLNVIALPIELLNFTTKPVNNEKVLLKWSTATEKNNAYFSLQRSRDGVKWQEFEKKKGAGDSQQLKNYDAWDYMPYEGINYYRLEQFDQDGASSFSPIRTAIIKGSGQFSATLYPNPGVDKFYLQLNEISNKNYQIDIFNQIGERMPITILQQDSDIGTYIINAQAYPAGYYQVRITDEKGMVIETLPMVKN